MVKFGCLTTSFTTESMNAMENHTWQDRLDLAEYRKRIETVNSQLERMRVERLYAQTNLGFEIKLHASLLAITLTNAF